MCKTDVEEIIAVIGGRGIEGQVCAAEVVLIRGRQRAGEVLRQWYAKSIRTGSSLHDTTTSIRRGEIDHGFVLFIALCMKYLKAPVQHQSRRRQDGKVSTDSGKRGR